MARQALYYNFKIYSLVCMLIAKSSRPLWRRFDFNFFFSRLHVASNICSSECVHAIHYETWLHTRILSFGDPCQRLCMVFWRKTLKISFSPPSCDLGPSMAFISSPLYHMHFKSLKRSWRIYLLKRCLVLGGFRGISWVRFDQIIWNSKYYRPLNTDRVGRQLNIEWKRRTGLSRLWISFD